MSVEPRLFVSLVAGNPVGYPGRVSKVTLDQRFWLVVLPFFVSVYLASLPMVGAMTPDDVRIMDEILNGLRTMSAIVIPMLGFLESVAAFLEQHYCHQELAAGDNPP